MVIRVLLFIISLCFPPIFAFKKMVANKPVVDIRLGIKSVASHVKAPALSEDMECQASQLLIGERVLAKPSFAKGWLFIKALEQNVLVNGKWGPCEGFVREEHVKEVVDFSEHKVVFKSLSTPVYAESSLSSKVLGRLSLGTMLPAEKAGFQWWRVMFPSGRCGYVRSNDIYEVTPHVEEKESDLRKSLISLALQLKGSPYVWGGRSAHDKTRVKQITGFDCSRMLNLVFRAHGLQVSPMAHGLYTESLPIKKGKHVAPGDLVFFSGDRKPSSSNRVSHVMMYLGDDKLIEATATGFFSVKKMINPAAAATRVISAQKRLGKAMKFLVAGNRATNGCYIFFGSLLKSKSFVQLLREKARRPFVRV